MILEKELIIVYLDPKAGRRILSSTGSQEEALFHTGRNLSIENSKPMPTVMHSNKAMPPNSALFNLKHINSRLTWVEFYPEVTHPLIFYLF